MVSFDHVCLVCPNVYEGTFRLSRETGIGNYDGGFFPTYGLGHKVVSLAPDIYIEVEGVVDHRALKDGNPVAKLYEAQTMDGDRFLGWCLRTDSMDEMRAFAAHHGTVVDEKTLSPASARQMMNGQRGISLQTPSALTAWPKGKPNLYYKPPGSPHPAAAPPEPGTGSVVGRGLAWIEIGQTRDELAAWLGDLVSPEAFPFEIRYNGLSSGLHALGVETSAGLVEIRRAPPKL